MISIVITTFERRHIVGRAVDSALAFIDGIAGAEIIIVDDCSTDGSFDMLEQIYRAELAQGHVRLLRHGQNQGVTAAKNSGAFAARAEWVTFLDSDDLFLAQERENVCATLRAQPPQIGLVFFPVVDLDGQPAGGGDHSLTRADLASLISGQLGERLPVIRRSVFAQFPYEPDLRGFEGISYIRIVCALGPQAIATAAVRAYDTGGADRLSTASGVFRRRCALARGWAMVLRAVLVRAHPKQTGLVLVKLIANAGLCLLSKLMRKERPSQLSNKKV